MAGATSPGRAHLDLPSFRERAARGILAIVLPSSFAASGSILGHAIVWHRPRNDIGEPKDLADGKPVFGGSAHRPPPQRAEPGQCAGVNWLGSMMATTGDS
jgi:hypothetical protein